MKYEKKFKYFEDKLNAIHQSESDIDRSTTELYGLIMEIRDFIRGSKLTHPNFKKVQASYLQLFTENSEIIEKTIGLSDSEINKKFIDCYTNMTADLREIAARYERLQS